MPATDSNTVTARAGDTLDELVWRTCALGPADLPAVQQDIVDLAARGAWEVSSQEDPWFGVHAEDEEDADAR